LPSFGDAATSERDQPDSYSENEEANVNIFLTTVVPPAELLEEKGVLMDKDASQPDEVGYADDEDEEDVDDLDADEDQDDEDDEDLDYDLEEVPDEDEAEDEVEEDEEEE
jgi:hypothetical protein